LLRNITKFICLLVILVAFGCSTDNTIDPADHSPESLNDLDVPENFDWDFTQEVDVTITTVDSDGNPVGGKTVSLYKTASNLVFEMNTNEIGILETQITLPESAQNVIMECDGEQFTVAVTGSSIDYQMVVQPGGERSNSGYVYVPGINSVLTMMYEDNWPVKGDYDFNDLVVETWGVLRYQYDYLRWIELNVKVIAAGATYDNGFNIIFESDAFPDEDDNITFSIWDSDGNQLPLTSEQILSTYGTNVNFLESPDPNQIQFKFFSHIFDVMPPPLGCLCTNTNEDHPWVEPITIKIRIDYGTVNPPWYDPGNPCFNLNAFNPFININGDIGHEIHLPGEFLSGEFNQQALFGTGDDNTPPDGMSSPLYESDAFTTIEGYSWALKLEGRLEYPTEKSDVILAYPRLGEYFDGTLGIFENWWQPHPDPDHSEGYVYDRQDLTVEEQEAEE